MNRSNYYEELKALARSTRDAHGLTTPRVTRTDMRRIFKHHGVRVDIRDFPQKVRGAYFNDEHGVSVGIARWMPDDPAVFTMAHELKHHLVDSAAKLTTCSSANDKEPIEIGAEVFAAELIFPEQHFTSAMEALGVPVSGCTPEHIVQLKEETRTTLSYKGLTKRAERLGFSSKGAFDRVESWSAVRDSVYGVPRWRGRRF